MDCKKAIISGALLAMLSFGVVSIVDIARTNAKVSGEVDTPDDIKQIEDIYYFEQYTEVPEPKTFEPGQHVFFIRYNYTGFADDFKGGSVPVPEGYNIMDIENCTYKIGSSSQTRGVDVWYVNTETVLVEPVYKKDLQHKDLEYGYYDYCSFGTVIKNDKDNDMKLTK